MLVTSRRTPAFNRASSVATSAAIGALGLASLGGLSGCRSAQPPAPSDPRVSALAARVDLLEAAVAAEERSKLANEELRRATLSASVMVAESFYGSGVVLELENEAHETGFYVLTDYHVFQEFTNFGADGKNSKGESPADMKIKVVARGKDPAHPFAERATLVLADLENELTIFALKRDTTFRTAARPVSLEESSKLQPLTHVFTNGFPEMVGPVQTEGVLAVPGVDLQMSPDDPNPHSRFLVTASTSKGNSGGPTFEQSSCRLLGLTQENMVTHVGFEVDQGEGKPKLSGTYGAPVNHLTTISTPQQLWALLAKAKLTPVGQSAP